MVAPVLPLLLLLLVSCLLPCEAGFWANSPPLFQNSQNVRSFTKDNFTAGVLMSDVVWVVDFYAPWCPHCKHFAPHFEDVADHYSDSTTVKYGAVDCTTEDKLCAEYEVMGYPQLRLFNLPAKGSKPLSMPFRHNGKKFDGVVTWVEEVFAEHNQTTGVDLPDFDLYKVNGHGGTAPPKKQHLRPDIATKQSSRDRRAAHLRDAGLALALSLETGMFLGSSVLAGTKYATAERWLQLLIARFPLAQNRQALATLLNRVQSQRSWALAEWKDLITTWKLDDCPTCYSPNNATSDLAVVAYLEQEYSVPESETKHMPTHGKESGVDQASMLYVHSIGQVEVGSVVLMSAFVMLAVYARYYTRGLAAMHRINHGESDKHM
ncbi:hypothetical protein DYB36_002247 [Aphanomyces astaci]|uniref:Thioredoxin domain-containing protein n=1 Tax=Aphanomyces astaci TaxID=112090 RepID=A0A397BLA5_APHAT|nr:hypothetical protein DYB36_002247 [Aphanomyces astaci]